MAIAERIGLALLALAIARGDPPTGVVSASFGVATVAAGREAQLRPADLVARADARLYEAKAGGRNTQRA